MQIPLAHSPGNAHVAPADAPASVDDSHRRKPLGLVTQPAPAPVAQHCGLAVQFSPSLPHVPAAWHTETDSEIATQDPEQQSALPAQISHSARHPPAAAQRIVPSLVARHSREQQSLSFVQTSSTCAVHGPLSLGVQLGSAAQ